MCGRYILEDYEELSERLVSVPLRYDFHPHPTWNAAPTQTLPVLVEEEDEWVLKGMHWGLIPRWTKPGDKPKVMPINARSETVSDKPMFRNLLRQHRCLVPANGFYEWRRQAGGKQPYLIHLTEQPLMLFAGLWDEARGANDEPIPSFTILTTNANDVMARLHDRMPVILDEQDDLEEWMSREQQDTPALERLFAPIPSDALEIYPVSRAVNNTRNNSPDLIEPLEDMPATAESDD